MGNQVHRTSRAKRIAQKQRSIRRQVRIAKSNRMDVDEPHRYAKLSVMDCGNPNCWVCANGGNRERTLQEIRSIEDVYGE